MIVNTQNLQQQVLDDFAFHLGYNRDTKTGGYKRDLFHICHSPFRRLNYNTMVLLYNRISQCHISKCNEDFLVNWSKELFTLEFSRFFVKSLRNETPIETIYLQYAKKKRTILCHKHQIKFSSCEAGQMMKEYFEREYYSYVH